MGFFKSQEKILAAATNYYSAHLRCPDSCIQWFCDSPIYLHHILTQVSHV